MAPPMTCTSVRTLTTFFTLLTTAINRQSPADLQSPTTLQDGSQYDFIIVGAGAAGCILANRLTERRDWSVLLIEAGGEEPTEADVPAYIPYTWNTRMDWGYRTQPQSTACGGGPCNWTRGKVLGGSTVLHALIYNRGNRLDYDEWEKISNIGWGYKHVLPYFKKSENNMDREFAENKKYHSTGGYQSIGRFPYKDANVDALLQGFNEIGYRNVDINADKMTGVMLMQTVHRNGERQSSNKAFLEPIRANRPNLKVVTNVRVTKILIDPQTKKTFGVEYASEFQRNYRGKAFARKEVIVSGGTINSPQLLMLSGIGPQEILRPLGIPVIQNLKVGSNLQDHVSTTTLRYILDYRTSTEVTDQEMIRNLELYNQTRRSGPLTATGPSQVTAFTNSRYGNRHIDYPDIQYLFRSANSPTCSTNVLKPVCYYSSFAPTPVVARPKSRGYITINTTDPFSPPLIYANYFSDRRDMDVLVDSLNEITKLANTNCFKNLGIRLDTTPVPGCERFRFATDEYWQCAVTRDTATYFHYAGTCKMGPLQDRDAVVDTQLKVRGINGLRVIDASVMPTVVTGTILAPVMMIAEKGADLIKNDWK